MENLWQGLREVILGIKEEPKIKPTFSIPLSIPSSIPAISSEEAKLNWTKTQLFKILPLILPDFKKLSKEKQIKLTEALAKKPDVFAQVLAINVKDWDKFSVEKKRKIISAIYSPEQIEELEKWPWFDPVFALSAPVGFGIKDIARQAIRAGAKAALKETERTAGAVGSSLLAEAGTTVVAEPLEEKHPVLASILAPLVGVGIGVAAEKGTRALFKVAKKPVKPKLEEEVEKVEEVLKPEIKKPEVIKEAKVAEEPKVLEEKPKKVLKVEKSLVPDLEEITKGVKEAEEIVEVKPEIEPKIEEEVKSEIISEAKKEIEPEVAPEIKPEVKAEAKKEVKPEIKIEEKYPPGKEPWQMTRKEFVLQADRKFREKELKGLPSLEELVKTGDIKKISENEYKAITNKGKEILKRYIEIDNKALNIRLKASELHEKLIRKILEEGKPIPEEVLKDYPDLVEKYKLKSKKEPWKMTRKEFEELAVQRIEEPGVERSTFDKPHGIYTTPAKYESPHKELGGQTYYWLRNPQAKVLVVDASGLVRTNRGLVGESAGLAALRKLIGEEEFKKLTSMKKKDLIDLLSKKYPNIQWDKYYDSHEILEAYGAVLAREKGYDAILGIDKAFPEFTEYVGLTEKSMIPVKSHKEEIEQALKEGKPVPEEVLRDYPDLIEKYKLTLSEVKLYAGLPLNEVLQKGFRAFKQLTQVTREKAAKKGLYRLADILGYGKEIRGKDIKGIKTWTAKLYNLEDIVRRYGDYYPEVKEIEYAMKWIREPQANRWAYAVDETIMKPLNKLSKESKEKVFRILYRESLTGKPDPNVKNLSSEEKNVYRRVRKFLEIVWKDIKDSYKEALKKYIDAKPMSSEEKEILTKALEKADPKVVPDELKTKHAAFYRHLVRYAEMYPVPYYMPQRRTGGFMVKLIDPKTNEVIFAHDVETSAEAKRIAEAFEKGDYSVVKKWFKELGVPFDVKSIPKNVKVIAEEISRIPVEAGAEIPFSKIVAFLHTSAERAKKLPKEDVANFYMNLAEDIDNFLKSLGWSVHLIRRKNIPGFSLKLEDAEKRLRGYLYGYGLSKAKKQAMEHAYKAFYKLVHRKGYKPEGLIRELSDYLSYAFGTPEPREVRQLNRLIVLWFLGGRVKSALINATQNLTSGLAAYIHHKIPAKQLLIGLKKVFGKKGLSLEDRRALRKAIQEGWLDANIIDEMMNQWRGMNTIVDTAMFPFRYVETFVNRAAHFMGAFDYFRKAKKMPFDEAYKKALEVMLEGHFWASRYNRAPFERGTWGRLLTALQTFTFHYFRYAFDLASKKEWKALAWLLGSPMVLGGVVALPGGELVKEHVVKPLYRKITGRELEIDLSKHPGLKYGPLGYLSPSLSISVGVGFSEDPMRIYGGVIQSLWNQAKRSYRLWERGDKWGAIIELMPAALRDVFKAARNKPKLRTTFGEIVLDEEGRSVSLTGKEAFMMALGFKPIRIQKVFDMRTLEREIQKRRNEILRKFGTQFSKAETAANKKAVLRALIEYNKKIKEKAMEAGKKGDMIYYRYWNLMHITPDEVIRWAELNKRAEKGIRKEIQTFARQIIQ